LNQIDTKTDGSADQSRVELAMSDGVVIVGGAYGEPGRPTVLLAHGGGQTRYAWANVARRLGEAGWRALAVDLRGHGDSDWAADGNYSHERYGHDLIEIAEAMGSPPVLVGASLGGNAGMLAAGTLKPGAFRALVLVDVTPRLDPGGVDRILKFMDQHIDSGFGSYEEAAEAIADYLPHRQGRKSNVASLERYLRKREDGRYRWHWDPLFVRGDRDTRLSQAHVDKIATAASAIEIPILLLRGSDSELVSEEAVVDFLTLAPHAEFEDVGGAGHMIVGDRNDVFARTLAGFLEKVERGEATRRGGAGRD
jgi:pimeloyl-ACP methyl ester carboxylesterase